MKKNVLETLLGAIVLCVAAYFVFFAYTTVDLKPIEGGYKIHAKFNRVDGLNIGNDVRLGGIKIGTVRNIFIEPVTYLAVVEFNVMPDIKLPRDTSARVLAEGLLGATFLDLQPGAEEETLSAGGVIEYTQDSVNVVDLLGRFIFSIADAKEE